MKCGDCGANFIMHDSRAYGCSSHTNGGRHLCDNNIRVKREIAESVILENVKSQLLGDDVIAYITKQFQAVLHNLESKPNDTDILTGNLRSIDAKLATLTEAIEAVGICDTLANRLTRLEQEKADTELALADAKPSAPINFLPDVLPGLVGHWRELVIGIAALAANPHTTPADIKEARSHLHALLGTVKLRPRDGVLWAHPSPNAKSLVETRPLDGLHINRQKMVAGTRFGHCLLTIPRRR